MYNNNQRYRVNPYASVYFQFVDRVPVCLIYRFGLKFRSQRNEVSNAGVVDSVGDQGRDSSVFKDDYAALQDTCLYFRRNGPFRRDDCFLSEGNLSRETLPSSTLGDRRPLTPSPLGRDSYVHPALGGSEWTQAPWVPSYPKSSVSDGLDDSLVPNRSGSRRPCLPL